MFNTLEPRRNQFWKLLFKSFPYVYSSIIITATSLYQLNLIDEHYLANTNIVALYSSLSSLTLIAGITTIFRNLRPDFDTWWTKNPQYTTDFSDVDTVDDTVI